MARIEIAFVIRMDSICQIGFIRSRKGEGVSESCKPTVQPRFCQERTLFQKSSTPGALTMSSRSRLSGITAMSGLMFNSYKSR